MIDQVAVVRAERNCLLLNESADCVVNPMFILRGVDAGQHLRNVTGINDIRLASTISDRHQRYLTGINDNNQILGDRSALWLISVSIR